MPRICNEADAAFRNRCGKSRERVAFVIVPMRLCKTAEARTALKSICLSDLSLGALETERNTRKIWSSFSPQNNSDCQALHWITFINLTIRLDDDENAGTLKFSTRYNTIL